MSISLRMCVSMCMPCTQMYLFPYVPNSFCVFIIIRSYVQFFAHVCELVCALYPDVFIPLRAQFHLRVYSNNFLYMYTHVCEHAVALHPYLFIYLFCPTCIHFLFLIACPIVCTFVCQHVDALYPYIIIRSRVHFFA